MLHRDQMQQKFNLCISRQATDIEKWTEKGSMVFPHYKKQMLLSQTQKAQEN